MIFLHKYQTGRSKFSHTYACIIQKKAKKLNLENKIRIFIALSIVFCIYCCNFATIINKYTIYLHKASKMNIFSYSEIAKQMSLKYCGTKWVPQYFEKIIPTTIKNQYKRMKNKRNRLQIISEILRSNVVGSQEELLKMLSERQCEVTRPLCRAIWNCWK